MAWTDPRTFNGTSDGGTDATADDLNVHLRDNPRYLFDQSMAMIWNNLPVAIPNNASTIMTWIPGAAPAAFNSPGITVTGTTITPTVPGVYEIWANFTWAGNAAGIREAAIFNASGTNPQYIADTVVAGYGLPGLDYMVAHNIQPGSVSGNSVSISGQTGVCDGVIDSFQVAVFQTSGGALNIAGITSLSANLTDGSANALGLPSWFGMKLLGSGV
jgi:hypothetical protein